MRVGIVNDLKLAQLALRRLVEMAEDAEVAWIAENGQEAIDRCAADVPDLILMDLIMPEVDGVEATRVIMKQSPCPILVVTATVEGNLTKVYNAMSAGALDAVSGPTFAADGSLENTDRVLKKMRTMRRLAQPIEGLDKLAKHRSSAGFPPPDQPAERLLVVGASTGGPQAIADLINGLPEDFRPPVIVVQHLDKAFVPGFVSWLAGQTGWPAACVEVGDKPKPGEILVAASRDHLVMSLGRSLRYDEEPADLAYRPSVDAFFMSLKRNWPTPGIAVLLTGMGQDGAKGMKGLKENGWTTIAQDEATSVVWGMPRAAKEMDAATRVLPLGEMGPWIARAWARLEAPQPQEGNG